MSSSPLHVLLEKLGQPGALPPLADLSGLLKQLLAQLEALPAGTDPLEALRKPGTSARSPLRTDTPTRPLYVQLPASIEYVNVPPEALAPQLKNVEHDAAGNATLTVWPLLKT